MATVGDDFRQNLPQVLEKLPSGSGELHVLAVDDSLVDRKFIERLLKISSCKGEKANFHFRGYTYYCFFAFIFESFDSEADWDWNFAVTVVESGTRALQYLGLDGEKSSIGINVRKFCNSNSKYIPYECFLDTSYLELVLTMLLFGYDDRVRRLI